MQWHPADEEVQCKLKRSAKHPRGRSPLGRALLGARAAHSVAFWRKRLEKRPRDLSTLGRALLDARAAHSLSFWRSNHVKSMRKVMPSKPALRFASIPNGNLTTKVSAVLQHSFFMPAQTFRICGASSV